jgi:hypothetical protein
MKNIKKYVVIIILFAIIIGLIFFRFCERIIYREPFDETIYGGNSKYRFPGSSCPFGQNSGGCFDYKACNGWKGQTINPKTKVDMVKSVSLLCGNPGKENALNKNWNKSWLTDPTKQDGGKTCNDNLTGFTCKSGLCLDVGKNEKEQQQYTCAGYVSV